MGQQESTITSFGLVISYVVPGLTALLAASPFSPTLRAWLTSVPSDAPTVGGFLYLTIAAVAAGLTVSTVRWSLIDTLHHWTGIPAPTLNFGRLAQNTTAFKLLVEIHYHYYKFYSNMLVSILALLVSRRFQAGLDWKTFGLPDVGLAFLGIVFFFGSRDSLRKYYRRTSQLLAFETEAPLPPGSGGRP